MIIDCQVFLVHNVHMIKIQRMGRKPLGKKSYQFTCPPALMVDFDKIVADDNKTRSDELVEMIKKRVDEAKHAKRKGGK